MNYQVRTVNDEKDWDAFFTLAQDIYAGNPNGLWPQRSEVRRILNPKANPYFEGVELRIFLCLADGQPVGRSILVVNPRHWQCWNCHTAFFGFFESTNDPDAVKALFVQLSEVARELGADSLEGPLNPNHYSEMGILLDHFDEPPLFFETYNPPYYAGLLESAGFEATHRLHTNLNKDIRKTLSDKDSGPSTYPADPEVRVRPFNVWRFKRDLEIMREINNDAFRNNWPFLPLSRKEYLFSAKYLFLVTSPRLILIAEQRNKPVGVLQFVINFNRLLQPYHRELTLTDLLILLWKRRTIEELIGFTGAIRQDFHGSRIAVTVMLASSKILRKFKRYSTSWIAEGNKASNHIAKAWGMEEYKHFAIYGKKLLP